VIPKAFDKRAAYAVSAAVADAARKTGVARK
jgi:malic enzyme